MAFIVILGSAYAQPTTDYTFPLGIYTVKVEGKTEGAAQARTYLGIQLLPFKRFQGPIDRINGNELSLLAIGSHVDLQDSERKSYVQVISGSGNGFIADIEEFNDDHILCAENPAPWMDPNAHVVIRPHFNLADVFGADNRFRLGSGPDADQADNVMIWDSVAQQEVVYYFHSTRLRWERKGVEGDASHAILRFPYGLYIVRRTPGTLWLVLKGEIGSNSVLLPVRSGANVLSLPINLSASLDSLIPSGGLHSVFPGPNANQADLLTFEEPSTGQQRGPFYFLSRSGNTGWREVGVNGSDDSIQPLDLLSTLSIERRGPAAYIFAEGSLIPGPGNQTPPVAEPGMPVLTAEFGPIPLPPADVVFHLEVSTDLQTWVAQMDIEVVRNGNILTFPLPAGYPRGFYRLGVTFNPL